VTCQKCGGPLYLDRRTISQCLREGLVGARLFCRLGCGDVWIKQPIRRPEPTADDGDESGSGKYIREARTYHCEACVRPGTTRGNHARWCAECKAKLLAERERARYAQRTRRRVSAA
jgi:hypothetical protein